MSSRVKRAHNTLCISTICAVSLAISPIVVAQSDDDIDLDNISVEIVEQDRDQSREHQRGHRLGLPYREIVLQHMLENGEIKQEDIKTMRAEFKRRQEDLRAAREAGDLDEVHRIRDEMMQERVENRDSMKEYVANNKELRESLRDAREEQQDLRREQNESMREERREETERRREERREQNEERREEMERRREEQREQNEERREEMERRREEQREQNEERRRQRQEEREEQNGNS